MEGHAPLVDRLHPAAQPEGPRRDAAGELPRNLRHAARRHRRRPPGEHPEAELELPEVGPERAIEEDAAEEAPKEAIDELRPHGSGDGVRDRTPDRPRRVGPTKDRRQRPRQHRRRVAKTDRAGEQGAHRRQRMSQWIRHVHEATTVEDLRARGKPTQTQSPVVETTLRLRVGRQQDLKAAIDAVSVVGLGGDATSDAVRRVADDHGVPQLLQAQRAAQATQAGADDRDSLGG